ncbi:leucine rich repeat protein windpipe [Colletes latitarsis]|uniref:leucine rich repeat protein windpipe n=1 Tax=Colletes latitarsis TaxID=2605962 RepID=UPI0040363697
MQTVQSVLSLLLIILSCSGWTNGLCSLENGTVARCNELRDIKYIETYDLVTLKTYVQESVLRPGSFNNLTSLRHLDLSGGNLKRIEAGSFRKLSNLRSLNLAENYIGHLEFDVADDLRHLHSLNLRKNNFQHLPSSIAQLNALKHLDVHNNPLRCDCATLQARDLIVDKGVKISKNTLCSGPGNMKGTSLFEPDATIVCKFEEEDREMQRDQADVDPEEELGSGNDKLDDNQEYHSIEVPDASSEAPETVEIETPFSETPEITTSRTTTQEVTMCSSENDDCFEKAIDKDGELFFDSEERKETTTTPRKKTFKDALFHPVDGSGEGEEGSGEGSGTDGIFDDWKKTDEVLEPTESEEELSSLGNKFLNTLFNVFWSTTELPQTKKDLDLEEEQFIDASVTKEAEEKTIVPKKIDLDETMPPGVAETTTGGSTVSATTGVELVDGELNDLSKTGDVKLSDEDDLAEMSSTKQSKKGMGSYVVLAALLAILATLIVFAAYKGDFCKKKRKRGDVENGTELKDMQKALLETGNALQPKVASNGNVESVPLVEDATIYEDQRRSNEIKPKSLNGSTDCIDPVKPPRRTNETPVHDMSSYKTDSLSARASPVDLTDNNSPIAPSSEINVPPLSPGAQRVKITLQDNPDSVPKTPILITRTMAGDNLVKKP